MPGIADINESGGYEKQNVIQPKPEALETVGMTFSELADLVGQNLQNAGGGFISGVSSGGCYVRIAAHDERIFSFARLWRETLNGQTLPAEGHVLSLWPRD